MKLSQWFKLLTCVLIFLKHADRLRYSMIYWEVQSPIHVINCIHVTKADALYNTYNVCVSHAYCLRRKTITLTFWIDFPRLKQIKPQWHFQYWGCFIFIQLKKLQEIKKSAIFWLLLLVNLDDMLYFCKGSCNKALCKVSLNLV